jgi:hypothetical protein
MPGVGSSIKKAHGRPCPYCGTEMIVTGNRPGEHIPNRASRDHIRPRSEGMQLLPRNRCYCCAQCNSDKSNLTLVAWAQKLKEVGDMRWMLVEAYIRRVYEKSLPEHRDQLFADFLVGHSHYPPFCSFPHCNCTKNCRRRKNNPCSIDQATTQP